MLFNLVHSPYSKYIMYSELLYILNILIFGSHSAQTQMCALYSQDMHGYLKMRDGMRI